MSKPFESADEKDYIKGWTVQQGPAPLAPETVPGNVVKAEELPYDEALAKTGIDKAQFLTNVVVAADEAEKAVLRGEAPKAVDAPVEDAPVEDVPAEEPAKA